MQAGKEGVAKAVGGEQAVDVAAHDPAIRRDRAVGTAVEVQHRPRERRPAGAAEVHLVAVDRLAARDLPAADLVQLLVAGQHRLEIEQPQTVGFAGRPLDAGGIGDAPAEHLEAAADPEHGAAAADVRREVDVPALRA